MSLNWNIGDIENYKELHECTNPDAPEDERLYKLNGITDALIWATMAVGMGKITESNYEAFYARLRFAEKLNGNMALKWDEETEEHVPLDVEDVKRHIGLSTNVSPETKAKFIKKQVGRFERTYGELK